MAQASGTRNKFWVNAPEELFEGKEFLFKESKTVLGELWAEKITAEMGKLLNLSMMHVQFAKYNETYGVIMQNFSPKGFELRDGGTFLSKSIPNFDVNSLDYYTIENIMIEISRLGMETQFIELCLFDALVACTDRHCENWGVIFDGENYHFSPIYDNGSALGFNVHDKKLNLYASDLRAFQAFTNRTQTLIEVNGNSKPKVAMLLNYLYDNYKSLVVEIINNFKTFDLNKALEIINKVPEKIMSKKQKEWVYCLIAYRHQWLTKYKWRGVET
ncbi:HipA domain-containing protein [Metasolibacillus meyeri]|uniref:HipA domain-containing protein n=1 Tax=Metasolibacillus meyeri TaxID=1071052 RepID=UPI000D2FF3DC|nr:HipA domain-containing protein [Metasolibacillus meyeri]